jgi:hypothetical protein
MFIGIDPAKGNYIARSHLGKHLQSKLGFSLENQLFRDATFLAQLCCCLHQRRHSGRSLIQLNFAGAMKAADALKESGLKAVKLEQMSQVVTTLSRDLARRAELALTLRY